MRIIACHCSGHSTPLTPLPRQAPSQAHIYPASPNLAYRQPPPLSNSLRRRYSTELSFEKSSSSRRRRSNAKPYSCFGPARTNHVCSASSAAVTITPLLIAGAPRWPPPCCCVGFHGLGSLRWRAAEAPCCVGQSIPLPQPYSHLSEFFSRPCSCS